MKQDLFWVLRVGLGYFIIGELLPGKQLKMVIYFRGGHVNKCQVFRETGVQRQYCKTENVRKQLF